MKFMMLMNSPSDSFLSNDTYLRDKSKDVIKLCKENYCHPKIELYPESSWLYFKNFYKEKYIEFGKGIQDIYK